MVLVLLSWMILLMRGVIRCCIYFFN